MSCSEAQKPDYKLRYIMEQIVQPVEGQFNDRETVVTGAN